MLRNVLPLVTFPTPSVLCFCILQLRMKQDESCVVLCQKIHTQPEIDMFKTMIDQEYRVHWLLDNLPVAVRNEELGYVSRGYPVGFIATTPKSSKPQHYLFNHVRIVVRYHESPEEFEGGRIVGFEVVPFSIKVTKHENTTYFDLSDADEVEIDITYLIILLF